MTKSFIRDYTVIAHGDIYLLKIEGYVKSFMAWIVQLKKAADEFVENVRDEMKSIESEQKDSEMVSERDGYKLRYNIR